MMSTRAYGEHTDPCEHIALEELDGQDPGLYLWGNPAFACAAAITAEFDKFDDFSPDAVANQVEPLQELLEKRRQLSDLKGKLASNFKLDQALQAALGDEEKMGQLKGDIAEAGAGEGGEGDDG